MDLLVVGAGIVGCGVARMAARLGLAVTLVDRGDIAAGTSSRSSRMIHGGLRYLEHGRLGLVAESLRERAALLRLAPHLVAPTRFLVPFHRGGRLPRWKIRAGLALYDALAGRARIAAAGMLTREQALARMPALSPDGLLGAGLYADAVTDDARLALAVARDAAARGAEVLTYTEVTSARACGDGVRVQANDLLGRGGRQWVARAVVNATGPWSDEVAARLAGAQRQPRLRASRGSHLVFPRGALAEGLLLTAHRDGRVFFLVPAGDHVLVGTTEVEDSLGPGADLPAEDEVRYLLDECRRALPGAGFDAGRAVGLLTGVRPLLAGRGSLGRASREHHVFAEGRVVTVVGGKYTTFRPMSRDVMRRVLPLLGRPAGEARLDQGPLPGCPPGDFTQYMRSERQHLAAAFPTAAEHVPRLLRAHGSEARQVLAREPREARPLAPGVPALAAEVRYAVEAEHARRLDDVLRRRTALWLSPDFGRRAAGPVARRMAELLGWSGEREAEELERWSELAAGEERLLRAACGGKGR